jgi:hypothetical protein
MASRLTFMATTLFAISATGGATANEAPVDKLILAQTTITCVHNKTGKKKIMEVKDGIKKQCPKAYTPAP